MKNIKFLSVMLVAIFLLAGCGTKEGTTTEGFLQAVETKGFEVTDVFAGDATESIPGLLEYYIAQAPEGSDYFMEYIVTDEKDTASQIYGVIKENAEANKGSVSSNSNVSGAKYSVYTQSSNGVYYHMVQVNNTIISAEGNAELKNEMTELIEALGY